MSKQELLEEIIPEIISEFNKIVGYLSTLGRTPTIEEMEVACRTGMRKASTRLMEAMIAESNRGYRGTGIVCSCGNKARFEGYRKKTVQTLLGDITFRRAYYHCAFCGEGVSPMDEALGVSRKEMSRVLERSICRLATVESFESACEDIYELTGASVSAKTIQTASEEAGEKILYEMQREAEEAVSGEREVTAKERPDRLCIAMDGKMIPTLSGHKEMKVAAVYDLIASSSQNDTLDPGKTSYLGQFADSETFGESVWLEGLRRGAETAGEVVILGDGAHWIWNQAQTHYPEAVQILDYFHVSEHIWELGNTLYGEGRAKTKRFVTYKLDQIKEGKVRMVIAALSKLKVVDVEKKEKLRETIGYLESNRKRMKYPRYKKKGYHIGSGVVESAAKQFGARLDQAGMRWTEQGAGAIAALRALRLSGRWDQHWQPVRMPLLA